MLMPVSMRNQFSKLMKRWPTHLLAAALVTAVFYFGSCSENELGINEDDSTDTDTGTFEPNTKDTTFLNAVYINYAGTTATVTNPYENSGVTVSADEGNITVTSTVTNTEINYVLSGIAEQGSFKLYSSYKFGLVLNGTGITNINGPAINIQSGKKATVLIVNGTSNQLKDGTSYITSEEDQKATLFSEGQLIFTGNGSLSVTGNYKHGICSDDYISITEGTLTIANAASDGIHANDYIKVSGGTLKVTSSGDGLEAEDGYIDVSGGEINITTLGEKSHALKSESYTAINTTGSVNLSVSGRASKGVKSSGDFTLTNGNMTIKTTGAAFYDSEDADITAAAGINCDGDFVMDGGILNISSTGSAGKGITVDGTLTVNQGTLTIVASGADFTYQGNSSEAKGIKSDGALLITGGTINIAATDDGLKSETSITINDGTLNITKSTEGIEAPGITFLGGVTTVTSSDDCINSTKGNGGESNDGSLITFSGGSIALSSSGGDAIDSNGNIVMTGGVVIVQGPPSAPEVALDYNGTFKISGGVLIGSGPNAGQMIQATSTSSDQYTALIKISGNVSSGTPFNIQDASGNNLVTYKPSRSAYYFIFSSSDLKSGSTYKVYTGGSVSGGTTTNGYTVNGTYTPGTLKGSFTVNSKVTNATF